jgi:hypothetical protein
LIDEPKKGGWFKWVRLIRLKRNQAWCNAESLLKSYSPQAP